jgi:uncharacterized protein YgiB involved in biofilm formation
MYGVILIFAEQKRKEMSTELYRHYQVTGVFLGCSAVRLQQWEATGASSTTYYTSSTCRQGGEQHKQCMKEWAWLSTCKA